MNCTKCNSPLEMNARFCPKCGEPVTLAAANNPPAPSYQPTIPMGPPAAPLTNQQAAQSQPVLQPTQFQPPLAGQLQQQPQPTYYAPQGPGPQMNSVARDGEFQPRRRRRGGCFTSGLITLIVLLALLSAAWFLALRPYLHALAQTQIDQAFTSAVQQMPPQVALVKPGPFPVSELTLNNLIQLNLPPNDFVKNVVAHITSTDLRIDFQVEGMQCAVTGVPSIQNGQLVVTNVNVEGIAALIMSNDEVTATLDRHLAEAQAKLNHPILAVHLANQEMTLLLGPPNGLPLP